MASATRSATGSAIAMRSATLASFAFYVVTRINGLIGYGAYSTPLRVTCQAL